MGRASIDSPPTWHHRDRVWRKRGTIGGKKIERRWKLPNTIAGARQAAQEWSQELSRIKAGAELSELQNKAESILAVLAEHPEYDREYASSWTHAADQMKKGISEIEAQRRGISLIFANRAMQDMHIEDAHRGLSDALGKEKESKDRLPSETVADVLRLYLSAQDRRRDLGEIRTLRHASIRRWVNLQIESELGQASKPETEEELGKLISDYRRRCEDELIAEKYGKGSFDDRMKEIRAFTGWASENYHLPHCPRNLSKLTRKFAVVDEGASAIPMDVLERIAEQATGPLAAAIALSLNCGFYSNDIASISMDDIEGSYLLFTREKTGVKVCYKLWQETQKLVKKYGISSPENKPWYEVHSKSRTDRLGKAFRALQSGYSYRNLRDTGASLIEQIDRRWTDSYLAHADKRIAKLYIDSNSDQREIFAGLHDATDEMRTRLLPVLKKLVP